MGKQYYVTCEEECAACGGSGYVHPYADEYLEFNRASDQEWLRLLEALPGEDNFEERHRLREAFDEKWWADRGWPGGVNRWPTEEEICCECEGSKRTVQRVRLEEALRDLGFGVYDQILEK